MTDISKDYNLPSRPIGGLQGQPKNTNLLFTQNFTFNLQRNSDLSYFVQEVQIPERGGAEPKEFGFAIGPNFKQPSSGAGYSDFTVSFLVDEYLNNYYNIVTWMREGLPYRDFSNVKPVHEMYDEAYLIILTNKKVPFQKITFQNIMPVELSGLEFTYTDTEYRPLTATVKFSVNQYIIENL